MFSEIKDNLKEDDELDKFNKPIDHLMQRGDTYIPVRKGETEEEVIKHLEELGNRFAVEPTEEQKASGEYIQELVYSNPQKSGGLCWFEWVKNPDYKKEEPSEEVKEAEEEEVKVNAGGVREDAVEHLLKGYAQTISDAFNKVTSLKDASHILRVTADMIDERLYDEEDLNIQAMDIVNEFKKKDYKTMKDYQAALNDISAMEWDNKISRESYEEYVKQLQDAYNARKYR